MVLKLLVSWDGHCPLVGAGILQVHIKEFSYEPLNIWVGSDNIREDGPYVCTVLLLYTQNLVGFVQER